LLINAGEVGKKGSNAGNEVLVETEEEGVGTSVEGVSKDGLADGGVESLDELDDSVGLLGSVLNLGDGGAADFLEVIRVLHGDVGPLGEVLGVDGGGDLSHSGGDDLFNSRLHEGRSLERELHTSSGRDILLLALDDGAENVHLRPVVAGLILNGDGVAAVFLLTLEPLDEAAVDRAAGGAGADAGKERRVSGRLEDLDKGTGESAVARGRGGHTSGGREVVVGDAEGLELGAFGGAGVADHVQDVDEAGRSLDVDLLAVEPEGVFFDLVAEDDGGLGAEHVGGEGDGEGVVGGEDELFATFALAPVLDEGDVDGSVDGDFVHLIN